MGTPAFAGAILKDLLSWERACVVGVFTQPDRPCGRGQKCRPSEVKCLAVDANLPVFQPKTLRNNPPELQTIVALRPDFIVVAAYGLILPSGVLSAPVHGCLNAHASILPKYRGAAPIQRAIMAGEDETGLSIMLMDEGLDTGPVLLEEKTPISLDDTAGDLHDRLAAMAGPLLRRAMSGFVDGTLVPAPQDHARASYAAKIDKSEGLIDWDRPARQVHDQIRALSPWPGAFFDWKRPDGEVLRLTVWPGRIGPENSHAIAPGVMTGVAAGELGIACRDRIYQISRLTPANRPTQEAKAFACGYLNDCP